MTLYSLASSSSGNCYLYEFGDTLILVDMGISKKSLVTKLEEINLSIEDIDQIFITHEHTDHIKGLKTFVKNCSHIVNLTSGTYENISYDFENKNIIEAKNNIHIKDVIVEPVSISHDAAEPVGYIFHYNDKEFAHITDTGYISMPLQKRLDNLFFYLIESNYENEALLTNPNYPFNVKKRINSDMGHLSNDQTNQYIRQFVGECTEHVCFAHLSEKNNDKDLVALTNKDIDINKYVLKKDEVVKVICK